MSTTIRAKFIEHMEFLGLAKQTQRSYINGVKGLAKYHNQSPEQLTDDQVRSYFRHLLLERKLARTSCGSYLSGIMHNLLKTAIWRTGTSARISRSLYTPGGDNK